MPQTNQNSCERVTQRFGCLLRARAALDTQLYSLSTTIKLWPSAMAYNSRYMRGYNHDELPINHHESEDEEEGEDLGNINLNNAVPLRSGLSPFSDTAYSGYQPEADEEYREPIGYDEAVSHHNRLGFQSQYVNLSQQHDREIPSKGEAEYSSKEFTSEEVNPYTIHEIDPEIGFRERQQPLKRGHTRKVKLVNGDIFCTDYP